MMSETATIPGLLRRRMEEGPDKTFLCFEGREISVRELEERSTRIASRLVRLGVRRGDTVSLVLDNRPEFALAWLGIVKAGAALVPINPTLTPPEVEYLRTNSESRLVITATELEAGLEDDPVPLPTVTPDDLAAIVYTSGTTGKPKGAMLTHANYVSDARAIAKHARMTPEDRFVGFLPFFHVNAQVVTFLSPLACGGSMVLLRRFHPVELLEAISRTRATAFSGVPTVYTVLNQIPGAETKYDLSRLRFCICGAAPMPVEVFESFERKYRARILEGYGLTEGTCASSVNPLDRRKVGSIGVPLDGQEMKILDGEIVIRGPNVMKGYYKNPEATRETIRDGWLHTGDLGRVDEDGFFWVVGRTKEMINRGGQKVWPREIEEVLYAHPAVAEAAVVGLADPKYGEEVAAFLVLKASATEREILEFCGGRLAEYKRPKTVIFRDSLPKTPTGKIQKHLLRG